MKHDSVLEVRDVSVRFGGLTALDAVSLTVEPRQVLGVIGPNGAGKTTLLNVLCGFIRPDEGQVLLDGRRYHDLRPHRLAGLGIARTLQGVGLFGSLSAVENVMIGANCRASAGFWSALLGLPRSGRDERRLRQEAVEALDRVGAGGAAASGRASCPTACASGSRWPAHSPPGRSCCCLTSPPAASPRTSWPSWRLIRELAAETSLVIVEHHMDLMMSVCDSLVVLDFGKVISRGSPQEIQADPAVTAAYLGVGGAGDE